ncbi:Flavin-dependent oxidoreductase, luciferase family (includes alkanesulfonate monooxygenase SsuD and methylene tetrahydromethanopterin reductase) [Natronorubrum sediminis]|uniref:Flavin-dependent oxidoreductase, luciferase family (Includes alkanesulfonate monooxygenase SsuD and methylene tetrahydromethanopterin reductase) n=1 Tax=Natronorubrum sediminis TaxID=640943 RepID=A0A1H6G7F5_9EURY|nr:LLM class flavin-dependent oxidoreductase [Natronorubrum sediminis]SEH17815.1 Flavin-dependent oxidoreductase, luciferase family (includes alkanesulfonate monooxygenase SsuD and methylene tetrahydromethanopterin reductase) [Natronorubrum sediminis]
MRLGYSINSAVPATRSVDSHTNCLLERVRTATDAGFEYVQAGDHHAVSDHAYLQNVPTLARLTAVTDHVAPLFLLPLHHPLHLAERCGTLATFADRFELWCALGYNSEAFRALDVPLEERVPRFVETLGIVQSLLTEGFVSVDGEYYSLDDVSISPHAAPERVCIGASAEPAVRRAGRLGDAWVALPTETTDEIDSKREWFESEGGTEVIARRDALVLEDGERARNVAADLLQSGYRGWDVEAEYPLVGDAETVAADLEALTEAGVSEVVVRPMSTDHAVETLRQCGVARDLL